jgi:DNA-binding transcriptional regulator YiaG
MKPALKAKLERLGPLPDAGRARSGSPGDLVLRPAAGLAKVRAIDAMAVLTQRGVSVVSAKRAIETMIDRGQVVVTVPAIDDGATLAKELRAAGIVTRQVGGGAIDIKALRGRLGLSQAEFARRYALDLATLQNWEQGRTQPDKTAQALLQAIAAAPDGVAAALEVELT